MALPRTQGRLRYSYEDSTDITALLTRDITSSPSVLGEILRLNETLAKTGENLEGNVCYDDQLTPAQYINSAPTSKRDYVLKRLNLVTLARRRTNMLEVGVNGGHSALICLLANPTMHFYGVDICMHAYTQRAAEYLKNRFGRRFHFWRGDSREVLPQLAIDRPNLRFDLLHIDGGHAPSTAIADMSNALRLASTGGDLILDDVNYPPLGLALEHVCTMGYLAPLEDFTGLYETVLHQIVRVC